MFFSLLLGALVIFFMFISFIKRNGPCLLMLMTFSFFYLNLRGWLLYFGYYEAFSYLNYSASYELGDSFIYASAMISLSLLITFIGYQLGRKLVEPMYIEEVTYSKSSAFLILFASLLSYFVYPATLLISGVLLVSIGLFQKNNQKLFLILGLITLFIVANYVTDDRRDFLAILLIPIFYMLHIKKLFTIRFVIISVITFILIVYISIALRSGSDSFSVIFNDQRTMIRILEVETDFSIVYDDLLYLFSENYKGNVEFLYGQTLAKPFFYLVPRELFTDKPESLSVLYSQVFNPAFAYAGGSQPITFVGDYFWNLGYFFIFPLLLFGYILAKLDNKYLYNRNVSHIVIFTAVVFSFLFSMLRGPFDTFFITFVFLFIFSKAFLRIQFKARWLSL